MDKPKYYAIEITPAIHYYMGGLTIAGKTRVINTKGQPIKGLFAAVALSALGGSGLSPVTRTEFFHTRSIRTRSGR